MSTLTLGIIGTAGRGDDAAKLTKGHYTLMRSVAQTLAVGLKATGVVSGGAAWADAIAVDLYLRELTPSLTLHLPCCFSVENVEYDHSTRVGATYNHYHAQAALVLGRDGREDIKRALVGGATVTEERDCAPTGFDGFFARNTKVATTADVMLAFTFGEDGEAPLKDGGTSRTMETFLKRREREGWVPLPAFHYNLTDKLLYTL